MRANISEVLTGIDKTMLANSCRRLHSRLYITVEEESRFAKTQGRRTDKHVYDTSGLKFHFCRDYDVFGTVERNPLITLRTL